jgi:hypothetical protein
MIQNTHHYHNLYQYHLYLINENAKDNLQILLSRYDMVHKHLN